MKKSEEMDREDYYSPAHAYHRKYQRSFGMKPKYYGGVRQGDKTTFSSRHPKKNKPWGK